MKKSLIALAALAATASYAQSSVEIYGIIDQAYTTTTSKYSDSDAFVSKATAVTSGTQSGPVSYTHLTLPTTSRV